jgi:hypothetical protein
VCIAVDGNDQDIGENVDATDDHQGIRVFHWNFLGDLHHPKDNDQVGAARVLAKL